MEVWKDIPGYEGLYQVSDLGRVKSLARFIDAGTKEYSRSYVNPERIRKTPIGAQGYPEVSLRKNGKTTTRTVHSLVTAAFLGPTPEGQEVRHKDGIASNCILTNLHFGTPKQNGEDRVIHGTSNAGITNGMHRFTEADVLRIRELRKSKSVIEIAKMYDAGRGHIYAILNREIWKHI